MSCFGAHVGNAGLNSTGNVSWSHFLVSYQWAHIHTNMLMITTKISSWHHINNPAMPEYYLYKIFLRDVTTWSLQCSKKALKPPVLSKISAGNLFRIYILLWCYSFYDLLLLLYETRIHFYIFWGSIKSEMHYISSSSTVQCILWLDALKSIVKDAFLLHITYAQVKGFTCWANWGNGQKYGFVDQFMLQGKQFNVFIWLHCDQPIKNMHVNMINDFLSLTMKSVRKTN